MKQINAMHRGHMAKCHASVPRANRVRCRRLRTVRVMAIGFDFGDRESAEPERKHRKKLTNLGTVAASLLVTAPIMSSGAVAQAFLACLAATQKFQASNKDVIASYTKFYGLLLSAGYDSWTDYLLDQLLMGRDNPVARSIAQGGLDDGAPVLAALAHDLDLLQAMAISLPDLAEYVGESAPFAGPEWVAAGSTASLKRPTKRLGSGKPASVTALNMNTPSKFITRPPTTDELTQWKDIISSKDSWSQALPVMRQFWHLHGFGITSRNTTLRWVKGALEDAPDSGAPATPPITASPTTASLTSLGPLSCLESYRAGFAANTQRHCDGLPASHVLIAGPSGSGKSWLLWDSTLAAGRDRGLRLVDLNGADGSTMLEAARGCARYPRLRFILVADHVDLPMRGAAAAELMAGLSNVGPGGWPSNTLLYLGASATSTVNFDPIVGRFGTLLFTKPLTDEDFCSCVSEMVALRTAGLKENTEIAGWKVSAGGALIEVADDTMKEAISWAKQAGGGLTVRSAAQYLDKHLV